MSNDVKSQFMFSDGKNIYKQVNEKYKRHKTGYVILGPPGIGKSYYVNKIQDQKNKRNWIDSDYLFSKLNVKWHQNEKNIIDRRLNYLRCDYMLEQSKALGYRVIGSLFWKFIPDAIVIPDLKTHKKYLARRKDLKLETVINIRNILRKIADSNDVPIFKSCEEAADFLDN